MLKVVFVLGLLFVCLAKSGGADDHPGLCWSEEHQKAYSPGDKWVSNGGGDCARYECSKEGSIHCVSCAQVHLPKGCGYHLGDPDYSKPFPECCPKVLKD